MFLHCFCMKKAKRLMYQGDNKSSWIDVYEKQKATSKELKTLICRLFLLFFEFKKTDENRRKSIIFAFVLHCVLHFILHRHKEWLLFPLHVRRLYLSFPSKHAHRWMRW